MPQDDNFLPFAVTALGICVPTYLLILIVNNPDNVKNTLANVGLFFTMITSCAAPEKSEKLKEKLLIQKHTHPDRGKVKIRRAATHASLEARLSRDLTLEPASPHRASHGFLQSTTMRMSQTLSHHLPGAGRHASQLPIDEPGRFTTSPEEMSDISMRRERSSTIKFDELPYTPSRWRTVDVDEAKDLQYVSGRWRTGDSDGTTLKDLEKSSTLNLSPLSPATTPQPARANGSSTPTRFQPGVISPVADGARQRSSSGTVNGSLLRRLSSRLSPMQVLPGTQESGSRSPEETV